MAIQTITYDDKVALNENPSVAEINKVTDDNMNEIKSVVNNNASETSTNTTNITTNTTKITNLQTYSTSETNTGQTWINNKPIYRKVINFGALPNTNGKSVAHGISNLDFITDIRILSKNPTYSYYISIPYTNKSNVTYQIEFYIDNTNIVITTGDNKSGYSNTYVILEYTKTTD